MILPMTPIYRELHRWAGLTFVWGETDCMMVVADWIMSVGGADMVTDRGIPGIDPAAAIRGTYDTRGSCQRETGFLRDPIAAVEKCLNTIGGLERVETPATGDIALIVIQEPDGRSSPCGAMWLGSAWACKSEGGTTTPPPIMIKQVLAIWSVGYEA